MLSFHLNGALSRLDLVSDQSKSFLCCFCTHWFLRAMGKPGSFAVSFKRIVLCVPSNDGPLLSESVVAELQATRNIDNFHNRGRHCTWIKMVVGACSRSRVRSTPCFRTKRMQCVCVGFATINVMLATCMLARWTLNGRVPEACWPSKEIAVQSVSGIGLLSFCAISKVEQQQ